MPNQSLRLDHFYTCAECSCASAAELWKHHGGKPDCKLSKSPGLEPVSLEQKTMVDAAGEPLVDLVVIY